MKKIVRTVWISMLTGLAFLVACTGPGKLTRAEKKQLKKERTEIVARLQEFQTEGRVDAENELLSLGPSIILDNANYTRMKELYRERDEELYLLERLVGIEQALKNDEAAKNGQQQLDKAKARHAILKDAIENAVPPCVYGPPPTQKEDRENIKQLNTRIEQKEKELDSISAIIQRREGACIYGSPEVIEKYGKETNRLREEAQKIHKELMSLKNERKRKTGGL